MSREALLVMDLQHGIVERFGDDAGSVLGTLVDAIAAARAAALPIVYVRVAFRDGAPEVSPRNTVFSRMASAMSETDPKTRIHAALAPQPHDVVVTKRRVSAFTGSDLDVVLRSLGVDSLVLTGIATSGVVLSTLRQAADLDFQLTVLEDGCMDADPEVHRVLMEKVFPRQASVQSATDWIDARS